MQTSQFTQTPVRTLEVIFALVELKMLILSFPDCSNGGGTTIIGNVGAKDQFWPDQRSVRVNSIRNGKHVVLYLGGSQSGAATRLYDPDGCINGDWLSYGIYNGGP